MPRRGPRLKIVRRLGTPLPGLTRKTAERRPYPPGAHGLARRRQRSDHARRLEEKQKVKFHYGVTERQLGRYFATASRRPGATGAAALALLERRGGEAFLEEGDAAQASERRDMALTSLERLAKRVARLTEALERVAQGTYGKCQICGREIEAPRLAAVPEVETCLVCQERLERSGHADQAAWTF